MQPELLILTSEVKKERQSEGLNHDTLISWEDIVCRRDYFSILIIRGVYTNRFYYTGNFFNG